MQSSSPFLLDVTYVTEAATPTHVPKMNVTVTEIGQEKNEFVLGLNVILTAGGTLLGTTILSLVCGIKSCRSASKFIFLVYTIKMTWTRKLPNETQPTTPEAVNSKHSNQFCPLTIPRTECVDGSHSHRLTNLYVYLNSPQCSHSIIPSKGKLQNWLFPNQMESLQHISPHIYSETQYLCCGMGVQNKILQKLFVKAYYCNTCYVTLSWYISIYKYIFILVISRKETRARFNQDLPGER